MPFKTIPERAEALDAALCDVPSCGTPSWSTRIRLIRQALLAEHGRGFAAALAPHDMTPRKVAAYYVAIKREADCGE